MKTQRFQLGNLLILATLLAVAAFSTRTDIFALAADEQVQQPSKEDLLHQKQAAALLSDLLIRNREAEVALAAARSSMPLNEQSFDSLTRVFEIEVDPLQLNPRTGQTFNVRTEALQLLKSAGPEMIQSWSHAREPFATADLRRASTLSELSRIERRYPLTNSGLKAGLSAATLLHLRGAHHLASSRLQTLQQTVEGTFLERELTKAASALQKSLENSLRAGGPDANGHEVTDRVRMSLSGRAASSTIAPAWPKASWSWQESIDDYLHAPQPVTWETLSPFVHGSFFSLDDFSNWRPILAGELVIHRTPLRIVALDAQSGQEAWSVPTDTIAYPSAATRSSTQPREPQSRQPLAIRRKDVTPYVESIRDMQAYGMMSADSGHLYFLDGFTLVDAADDGNVSDEDFILGPLKFSSRQYPQRLVALRLRAGDLPEVAWIAGTAPQNETGQRGRYVAIRRLQDFDERDLLKTRGPSSDTVSPVLPGTPNVDDVEPTLEGHVFLSPPCGGDDQLFVITEFARQTYVTSLFRQTGRILWQRPISHIGQRSHSTESGLCVRGNCLLCDGVLCCVFHDGVVVGLRPTDGQSLWVNAFRDHRREPESGRFPFQFIDTNMVLEDASIIPVANSSLIVALHPASDRIFAFDPQTGTCRWVVSRAAVGVPSVDGERDSYLAGITESHVVLLGEHHCRALDAKTGEQQWAVDTGESSGRAEVTSERCLIPQKNGQLLTIDLATGRLHQIRHRFLPEKPDQPWGALLCSDTHVFLSTPASVTSFLRSDAILKDPELFRSIDDNQSVLTKARLLLMNHAEEEAIAVLSDAAAPASENSVRIDDAIEQSKMQTEVHRTLAEVILQRWASLYVAASEETRHYEAMMEIAGASSDQVEDDRPARSQLQEYSVSEEAFRLTGLTLDSDQQLRAAMLALLSQPGFQPDAGDLAELETFAEWSRMQPMTDDWSVRPDLLLTPLIANAFRSSSQPPVSVPACRSIALKMLQFPELMADELRTEAVAQQLISLDEVALAEAFLLVWKRTAKSDRAESLLRVVRQSEQAIPTAQLERGFVSRNVAGKKLSVEQFDEMDIAPAAMTFNTMRQSSLSIARQLPSWLPYQISISRTADEQKHLNISERRSGTIVSTITPRSQIDDLLQSYSAESHDDDQPGLLPVLCSDSFEMLSLVRPERAKILWSTGHIDTNSLRSLPVELEFGPVLPECMIWYAGGTLHCTQPITGEDLWTRRMHLKGSEGFVRGLKRIFGDHKAIVVLSEDNAKYERFRTRDGQSLGAGLLRMRSNSDVLHVGRFLVYSDSNGQVCVFDGENGQHQMIEGAAGALPGTTLLQTFHRISGNRVVTINAKNEVIVFDAATAKVVCQVPLQPHLRNDQVFSLIVFEQHGRLFVGVEDELNVYRDKVVDTGEDLPMIRFGHLFHIDPTRGEVKWDLRIENEAFVVPAGDPTDILVAIRDTSWTGGDNKVRTSNIQITLIDGTTGKELIEETVSSRHPYRIAHFAAEGLLEFVAAETVTRIQVAADEASSKKDKPGATDPGNLPHDVTAPNDDAESSLPRVEAPVESNSP